MSDRLLSRADLRAKGITYHRQSIWRLVRARRFPPPIKLGSQTLAWWESEINAWLQDRTAERDATYRAAHTAPPPAKIKNPPAATPAESRTETGGYHPASSIKRR
jgi:prophage regulatory protein